MTSHVNINWAAVGEANRHEFETNAKWALQYKPQSSIARNVYSSLAKPYVEPVVPTLHRKEVTKASATPPPPTTTTTVTASSMTNGEGESPAQGSALKVVHCRRKHRKNCPKHLLHEKMRHDAAVARGEVPPPPSVPLEGTPGMPQLTIPHSIGKGLATFLTGAYNDKACKWERKLPLQHPDFLAMERAVDARAAELLAQSSSGGGVEGASSHVRPFGVLPEKLFRPPIDMTHYRRKYEMKTHMQAMTLMGKALLREFATNASFK